MIGMDIITPNDLEREENLRNYHVVFTKPEPVFDQLAALAATLLDVPLAMINFVDRDSVWAQQENNDAGALEPSKSMCSLAVLKGREEDFQKATEDLSLISNPLIAGEHGIKFYAAAPITTQEGFHVGTVCIVDRQPRAFGEEDKKKLSWIASMVQLEMSKRTSVNICA